MRQGNLSFIFQTGWFPLDFLNLDFCVIDDDLTAALWYFNPIKLCSYKTDNVQILLAPSSAVTRQKLKSRTHLLFGNYEKTMAEHLFNTMFCHLEGFCCSMDQVVEYPLWL